MVVAVACGLAAAVLTTQMTGKPAAPEQVEILVAARDLPTNTRLDKDKMAELVKKKKIAKADVPPEGAFFNEEELLDKYISRPRGTNDILFPADVSDKKVGLTPPKGKHLCTIKLPYEQVGPFIEPQSHVDLFVTVQQQTWARTRQFPLLTNVLVMAVDTTYVQGSGAPQGGNQGQPNGGRPQINTLTVALSPEESKWIDIVIQLSGRIKVLVRGEDSEAVKQLSDDELTHLFFDPDAANNLNQQDGAGGKPKTVKLWVPKTFLPAGTAITEETIKESFREKTFDDTEAGKGAVTDLAEYLGMYLLKDAERGEPIPINGLGEKPVEKAQPSGPTPTGPNPTTPTGPTTTPVTPAPVAKRTELAPRPHKFVRQPIRTWEPEITSPRGTEKHRYVMFDETEGWVYQGVIGKDGKVVPGPAPEKVPDAPKDEKDGKDGKIS
jgi:Flp pilus assembly protein CpaB